MIFVKKLLLVCFSIEPNWPHLLLLFCRLGQKENECLLVTIKTDGSGTVIIKPDFNKGREPYRWVHHSDFSSAIKESLAHLTYQSNERRNFNVLSLQKWSYLFGRWFYRIVTEGEKREFWRLTVENASTVMTSDEKDREQNIYKDVSSSLVTFNCFGRTNEQFLMLSYNGCLFSVAIYSTHGLSEQPRGAGFWNGK